jgi:hypothetical protein
VVKLYLNVGANGAISLEDHDDFTLFSIFVENNNSAALTMSEDFLLISEDAGNDHYWLDAEAVAHLSLKNEDRVWLKLYWQMLAKAEPFGYFDSVKRRVKVHLAK